MKWAKVLTKICGHLKDLDLNGGQRMKKRNGFSLVEVVVAFSMIIFIAAIVGRSVVGIYGMSANVKDLTNAYHATQQLVEMEIDSLSALVNEKYSIENELAGVPAGSEDPNILNRLNTINATLLTYTHKNHTLFGKAVDIFTFTKDYTAALSGENASFQAGVVNFQQIERPVPILDKVEIHEFAGSAKPDIYFGDGKTVTVTTAYNVKNRDKLHSTMYQWYVGTAGHHTTMYENMDTIASSEHLYNTLYTAHHNQMTMISGETTNSLTIKSDYYGKMVVCVATPLSVAGAMGIPMASEPMYISGLPIISGNYRLIADTSMIEMNYDARGKVPLLEINGRTLPGASIGNRLYANSANAPQLNLNGVATDSDLTISAGGMGTFSRCLEFSSSTYMRADLSTIHLGSVFVVAKNNSPSDVDFISWDEILSGGANVGGFATNHTITTDISDTGYRVLAMDLGAAANNLIFGKNNVEIVEVVITENTQQGGDDAQKIIDYLCDKYKI